MSNAVLKNRRWSFMQDGIEPDDYVTKAQLDAAGITPGYNYIIVPTTANAEENGQNLLLAYEYAKDTLAPQVGTLAADNRVTVLLMPGVYSLSSGDLLLDTSFIDVIGLCPNRDLTVLQLQVGYDEGISATIQNVKILHLAWHPTSAIRAINCDFTYMIGSVSIQGCWFENCKSSSNSFGCKVGMDYSITGSTFINCTGGNYSFGYMAYVIDTSRFINCRAGMYAFGANIISYNRGEYDNMQITASQKEWRTSFNGVLKNTTIESEMWGIQNVLNGAEFYNCKIISGDGSAPLATWESDVHVKAAFCIFNNEWLSDIVNDLSSDTVTDPMGLADGHNVMDET